MFSKKSLALWTLLFLGGIQTQARTKELGDLEQLKGTLRQFSATFLIVGHGSKSQIKDVSRTLKEVDQLKAELDTKYGEGKWLIMFGGDSYKPDTPDVAVITHYLKSKGVPLLAIQSDIVKGWGGVDQHIDYVYWVPTTQVDSKTVWGGFLNGKAVGPTAVYLGPDLIADINPLLKGVIAFGGGPIALEELKLAKTKNVPIVYIKTAARFPELNGPFGSVDSWAQELNLLNSISANDCQENLINK